MKDVHPDLLNLSERERLRNLKAEWVEDGLPEEVWSKTLAGQRLAILEAWWELMEKMVAELNATMKGRFALWLSRQRFFQWIAKRLS